MKKLNTDSITNELERSSFFPQRPAQAGEQRTTTEPPAKPTVAPLTKTVLVEPTRPVMTPAVPQKPSAPAVPVAAPVGRRYVRRTFDFYEDQVAYLTKASLEERLA